MELPNGGKEKPGRKPGQRRRTRLEIARDRAKINTLRLLYRKSVSEISAIISEQYLEGLDEETGLDADGKRPPHVGLKQVRHELEGAIVDYKEGMVEEIHAKRLDAIRRYDALAGLAFAEYEASKADKVVKTTEESHNPEFGTTNKEREVIETRIVGDKGFLSIAITCTDRIAELEAIVPPRKTALTNPDGTEPFKFEGAEELRRLGALAEELLNPASKDKLPEATV